MAKTAQKKRFGQDSDDNESSGSDDVRKPSISAFRKPLPSIAQGAKKGGFNDNDDENFKMPVKAKP